MTDIWTFKELQGHYYIGSSLENTYGRGNGKARARTKLIPHDRVCQPDSLRDVTDLMVR